VEPLPAAYERDKAEIEFWFELSDDQKNPVRRVCRFRAGADPAQDVVIKIVGGDKPSIAIPDFRGAGMPRST